MSIMNDAERIAELERLVASQQMTIARLTAPAPTPASDATTVGELLEDVIRRKAARGDWKHPGQMERDWRGQVRNHCAALIDRPAAQVTAADIEDVLAEIPTRSLAAKQRHRLRVVFSEAVKQRIIGHNPVLDTDPVRREATTHRESIPWADAPEAIGMIRQCDEWLGARLAVEFVVLTACRSAEATGAVWAEIDLDARVWTIPGERTKTGSPHRVPLSDQAVRVLELAAELRGDHVFPSSRGKRLPALALRRVLSAPGVNGSRGAGVGGTVHGWRSTFRIWAAETGKDPAEAEMSLGHALRSQVEAAYQRSDLLERRRALMADWGAYIAP